jgi:dienelactone hydrolase
VLDWIHQQDWVDRKKIVAWGVSCGGYYAMRIAHTHKDRLAGVVAHGGGCHHMFDPEWLEVASQMEYPFEYVFFSPLSVALPSSPRLQN